MRWGLAVASAVVVLCALRVPLEAQRRPATDAQLRCYFTEPAASGWFACIDLPTHDAEVSRSRPLTVSGWVLSCRTGKQPASLGARVGAQALAVSRVRWALEYEVRPILPAQACPVPTDRAGFVAELATDRLQLGPATITVAFEPDANHLSDMKAFRPHDDRSGPVRLIFDVLVVP